jgi:hypothetical protein
VILVFNLLVFGLLITVAVQVVVQYRAMRLRWPAAVHPEDADPIGCRIRPGEIGTGVQDPQAQVRHRHRRPGPPHPFFLQDPARRS